MDFETFWAMGIKRLKDEIAGCEEQQKYYIPNWRADKEAAGEKFAVVDADPKQIKCLSIHASRDRLEDICLDDSNAKPSVEHHCRGWERRRRGSKAHRDVARSPAT